VPTANCAGNRDGCAYAADEIRLYSTLFNTVIVEELLRTQVHLQKNIAVFMSETFFIMASLIIACSVNELLVGSYNGKEDAQPQI